MTDRIVAIFLVAAVIALALMQSGCDQYRIMGGAAVHDPLYDGNYWQDENPLGYVKAEANNKWGSGWYVGSFYEHVSVARERDGHGLNMIGVQGGFEWNK